MAEGSKIAWTDHTFNPWMGCQKVSPGCKHCYADTLTSGRMGLDVFGAVHKRQRTKGPWKTVARLHRQAEHDATTGEGLGRPHRVFCASLADVFEDAPGPNEWRDDVWELIRECPFFDWQLLTKRPENIAAMLPDDWGEGYPNVWLGTSIEDRRVVDRARVLAAVPAAVRFISYEPAIGPVFATVDETRWQTPELSLDGIHWLICGGESGPGHRPMRLEWAKAACHAALEAQIAFFFKQVSGPRPGQGEDALGVPKRGFPASWDRSAALDSIPIEGGRER